MHAGITLNYLGIYKNLSRHHPKNSLIVPPELPGIEYFENPPNVGSLDKNNPKVGTSTVGSVACGDLLKM